MTAIEPLVFFIRGVGRQGLEWIEPRLGEQLPQVVALVQGLGHLR